MVEARAFAGRSAGKASDDNRHGENLLGQLEPAVALSQEGILAPLPKGKRAEFVALLALLVEANNEHSRAGAGMSGDFSFCGTFGNNLALPPAPQLPNQK